MRTFIAIEMPPQVRDAIAAAQQQLASAKVRISWVKPEGIHLTVKFLGDIADEQVGDVKAALDNIAARFSAFSFTVSGAGAFPSAAAPRVLWLGCESKPVGKVFMPVAEGAPIGTKTQVETRTQLEELIAAVDVEMEKHGFAPDFHDFKAHVTLGRIKFPKPDPALTAALDSLKAKSFGTVQVGALHLMKSELNPDGATHEKISSHPLRSAAK
jgi:2'-5' RNA ligase